MKILYYDCFMGISGDMNLAAMIDLGVDKDYLKAELKKIPVKDYTLIIIKEMKNGIHGTKVNVDVTNEHHAHRGLKDIREIINKSSLNDNVKKISLATFSVIADAEAKIHNKPVDEIHFHEVGAIDSIVDIVGAAICLDYLKPDKIISSAVQLGGGMVKCAHGTFPVPAPATAEILKGKPVKQGAVNFEATTPTGAAILVANANEFSDSSSFSIEKIGYGLGHKDADIPNILRVMIASDVKEKGYLYDTQMVVETNIDDMSPELYEPVIEILFEAGAADVTLTPAMMKKSRPAVILSVICSKNKLDIIADIILKNTTSIGLRYYEVERKILERKIETIDTPYGKVKVKLSGTKNEFFKAKPEYEDCLRIAKMNKKPLPAVIAEIQQLADKLLKK